MLIDDADDGDDNDTDDDGDIHKVYDDDDYVTMNVLIHPVVVNNN